MFALLPRSVRSQISSLHRRLMHGPIKSHHYIGALYTALSAYHFTWSCVPYIIESHNNALIWSVINDDQIYIESIFSCRAYICCEVVELMLVKKLMIFFWNVPIVFTFSITCSWKNQRLYAYLFPCHFLDLLTSSRLCQLPFCYYAWWSSVVFSIFKYQARGLIVQSRKLNQNSIMGIWHLILFIHGEPLSSASGEHLVW